MYGPLRKTFYQTFFLFCSQQRKKLPKLSKKNKTPKKHKRNTMGGQECGAPSRHLDICASCHREGHQDNWNGQPYLWPGWAAWPFQAKQEEQEEVQEEEQEDT